MVWTREKWKADGIPLGNLKRAKRVSPANAGREMVSKMFIKAETTPIFLRVKSVKSFD
jgi:hypothetical protein